MKQEIEEVKQGIKMHFVKTDSFKTNIVAIFLTVPLNRSTVTKNALIPAVLRRGTDKTNTQDLISKELENLYGADFDAGIEKMGDNQIIKFYIESINDKFLPEQENILEKTIDKVLEIVFMPYLENGVFKKEYVDGEKNNLKQIIDSKIDNKDLYAFNRCIEMMYENEPYGLYKYGYTEDLNEINEVNLYNQYKELINTAKIDLFISGDFEKENVKNAIIQNDKFKKLNERKPEYIINNEETAIRREPEEIKTVEEKRDVVQGKLVMGMDILSNCKEDRFIISMYNTILGDSVNSKLFQNVREKANLAYTTRSNYIRQKNNIFIRSGIDIPNYEKAVKIINEQLEDMQKGNFSDVDITNAKKHIISSIRTVEEEQDTSIIYYLGQELSGYDISFEEYKEKIEKIDRKEIVDMAQKVKMNLIYFLRN